MTAAIDAAMAEYRLYEDAGNRKGFLESVGAIWPDWYFLSGQRHYPVKAIWAKASGSRSVTFNTSRAKRELENAGYGAFVNLTRNGEGVVPPTIAMSDLDEQSGRLRGGGESRAHRELKDWLSENPTAIGLPSSAVGTTELILPSADRIDIVFYLPNELVAVEVKPQTSGDADLNRGIFQCIKYQALLSALESLAGARAVSTKLAIAGVLPVHLREKAERLGVSVVEQLNPHISNKK